MGHGIPWSHILYCAAQSTLGRKGHLIPVAIDAVVRHNPRVESSNRWATAFLGPHPLCAASYRQGERVGPTKAGKDYAG